MKLLFICVLTLFPCILGVSAQEPAEKWPRLEMANRELSILFPPGFLVDAEDKKAPGRIAQFFGFGDQFSVSMIVNKDSDAGDRLKWIADLDDHNRKTFTANNFKGKRMWSWDLSPAMHEVIYLASDSYFYTFHIYADNSDNSGVQKFLFSIMVNGKPLYVQTEKKNFPEADTVVIENLKSSPEVLEAYRRKYQKRDIKISYEPMSSYRDDIKFEKGKRPPAILERGGILKYLPKDLIPGGNGTRGFTAKLKVNLLANGEVGDMTVFSDEPRGYQDACVESLRRAKFVPAFAGGKNINMVLTDSCIATVSVSSGLTR